MGIKEGTCCDEHWVMYECESAEPVNSTPKTNTAVYANQLEFR